MTDIDIALDSPFNPIPVDLEITAAEQRAGYWNGSLKPHDAHEVYLVDQIAIQSVRIDRCQHHERNLRRLFAKRARLRWAEDRRNSAEALGARLKHNPSLVARKLDGSKQGCEWLIARWEGLAAELAAAGAWDKAQKAIALDLLGVPPEFRGGKTRADGDPDACRALAQSEIDRLRALNSRAMEELDADEREMAMQGYGPDHEGQLAAVRRFERVCSRRLEWSRNQLRSYRKAPMPDGSGPGHGPFNGHDRDFPPVDRFGMPPLPATAPKSPEQLSQERSRAAIAARDAFRKANAAAPMPVPVLESAAIPATIDVVATPPATPAPVEVSDAPMVERVAAIARHPEYAEMPPATRLRTLLSGLVEPAAPAVNRKARRARDAHARRQG